MENYNSEFYVDMEVTSVSSAIEIIPILVNQYNPTSVVDIGCGTGAFAHEFYKQGIDDVIGYEGTWMRDKDTLLQKDKYVYNDLTKEIVVTRKFDLCLCLEVAEHLDFSAAETLISSLTALSSRVVFSAAIPKQGGNQHVNEQWPDYWAQLFAERGFFLEWDPRMSIWGNSKIHPCYRQNLLVFSKKTESSVIIPTSLVHPDAWIQAMKYRKAPFWLRLTSKLPRPLLRVGKRVISKIVRMTK
jgi:SAM-dependent methyltransferase